jgi:LAO/AO transport system kinase
VVNKADRDGAQRMQTELSLMLELKYSAKSSTEAGQLQWKIPVLPTQALNNVGMTELFQAIDDHHRFLSESGELARRRKSRRREELLSRVEYEARRRLTERAQTDPALAALLDEVGEGKIDAHTAAAKILGSEFLRA